MKTDLLYENRLLKILLIFAVLGVVIYFLFPFYPLDKVINLGLDLKGGTRMVLEAEGIKEMGQDEKERTIDKIVTILNNRVNQYGLTEPTIAPLGDERVLVELPGETDPQVARQLIGRTALLEFKKVVETAGPGGELVPSRSEEVLVGRSEEGEEPRQYLVKEEPLMTGRVLQNAEVKTSSSSQNPIFVSLTFNNEGAQRFAQVVRSLEPERDQMAIVLDGVVQSAPVIKQSLADIAQRRDSIDQATITGDFTADQAKRLAIVLRAGALPAEVNIIEENTVGPTLGEDAIRAGTLTILVGFLLILLFMPIRYRWLGVLADVVLLFNMLIMFGALSMFGATLTLPGIAGVILTIGISVDANIIIFERIREERYKGKTGSAAIRSGFQKSISTVVDANLTTLATAIILMYFGSGPVRGFAITLTIGILGSLFCALFVSRFVLEETWFKSKLPNKWAEVES